MDNYLKNEKVLFAFNIWDINSAKAVMDAAAEMSKNVILQTSASLFNALPIEQLRGFVTSYKKELNIETWLHLDHCKDKHMIERAIDSGWDSIMIDASDKPIGENIGITNLVSRLAHEQDVLVEAEIGQVKGVEDDISVTNDLVAKREDIDRFLSETNVDMLAVAFGNAHGVYKGTPELHYDLVEYTTSHTDIPFVVHGGSGLSDNILKQLMGISNVKKINISTEVKYAYRDGIVEAYRKGNLDEKGFQAVKVEKAIEDKIRQLVKNKLLLTN